MNNEKIYKTMANVGAGSGSWDHCSRNRDCDWDPDDYQRCPASEGKI